MRALTNAERLSLTTIISVLLVGGVVAAASGRVEISSVPRPPAPVFDTIPHINAVLSVLAIVFILLGWRAIRKGNIVAHRQWMSRATVTFVSFLILYLYRLTILGGPQSFHGPNFLYRIVYLPLLAVHITGAILCIPLLVYVLLIGFTLPVAQIKETYHARIGRIAAALWILSFGFGICVYILLYLV